MCPSQLGEYRPLREIETMLPSLVRNPTTPCRLRIIAIALTALAGLASCSGNDSDRSRRFPYIHDPNFKVENPSRDRASATGIGCGGTEKDALLAAQNTAKFNLRGVTGNGNYKIRFDLVREMPEDMRFCVEVKATAVGAV